MIDINLTLLGQSITFILLIWFCKAYVWPPVIKSLRDRQSKITEGVENYLRAKKMLEDAKKEAYHLLMESKREAKKHSEDIISLARTEADAIIEQSRLKAKELADTIVSDARTEVKSQQDRLTLEISEVIKQTSIHIAEALMRKEISSTDFDENFINSAIKKIPFDDIEKRV